MSTILFFYMKYCRILRMFYNRDPIQYFKPLTADSQVLGFLQHRLDHILDHNVKIVR